MQNVNTKGVVNHPPTNKKSTLFSGHCKLLRQSLNLVDPIQNWTCLFFINSFRHVELEIALAIPASNECKIKTNNSAAQGLTLHHLTLSPLKPEPGFSGERVNVDYGRNYVVYSQFFLNQLLQVKMSCMCGTAIRYDLTLSAPESSSVDVRFWRIKTIPALRWRFKFLYSNEAEKGNYNIYDDFKLEKTL